VRQPAAVDCLAVGFIILYSAVSLTHGH